MAEGDSIPEINPVVRFNRSAGFTSRGRAIVVRHASFCMRVPSKEGDTKEDEVAAREAEVGRTVVRRTIGGVEAGGEEEVALEEVSHLVHVCWPRVMLMHALISQGEVEDTTKIIRREMKFLRLRQTSD